jgi:Ferric reductase NAD binding domain
VALPYLLELQASLQAAGARLHLDIFLTGAASRLSQGPSHNPAAKDTEKEVYTTPDTPLSNLSSNDRFAQSLAYFPSKHEPKLEMLDLKYICVNIQEGRPDLDTIMKVADADQRPLTVVVCGPATLSDHARRVALNISRARKVHFFEECLDW